MITPMMEAPKQTYFSPNDWQYWNYELTHQKENTMTIGGENCHLCGRKRVRLETVDEEVTMGKKKRDQYTVVQTTVTSDYACHTVVTVAPKGKNTVFVGDECISIGSF